MLNIIVSPKIHNPKGERKIKKVVKFLKAQKQEFSVYFLRELSEMAETVYFCFSSTSCFLCSC